MQINALLCSGKAFHPSDRPTGIARAVHRLPLH
jgi:hypothetical protein